MSNYSRNPKRRCIDDTSSTDSSERSCVSVSPKKLQPSSQLFQWNDAEFPKNVEELRATNSEQATELKQGRIIFFVPILLATGTSKPITYLLATLSASIHLLSSNCVGQNDLDSDEILLKSFLIYLCHWFGEESSTMSVHALTHLVDQVHVYGPLWTTSASVFENFFHSLVHRLHGTRDEACLLVRNFFTSHLFH